MEDRIENLQYGLHMSIISALVIHNNIVLHIRITYSLTCVKQF